MSTQESIQYIEPNKIKIGKNFIRLRSDLGNVDDLADDIKLHNLKKPLKVVIGKRGQIELVRGERRLKGVFKAIATAKVIKSKADLSKVPVIFLNPDISEAEKIALKLEKDPNGRPLLPSEEAKGYSLLNNEYGLSARQMQQLTGVSTMTILNRISLLEGAPALIGAVDRGEIPITLAKKMIDAHPGDLEKQESLVVKCLKDKKTRKEVTEQLNGLTVTYAPKSIYQKPVRDMIKSLQKTGIQSDSIDDVLKQLPQDDHVTAGVRAGIVKGLQMALGSKMPNPFATT